MKTREEYLANLEITHPHPSKKEVQAAYRKLILQYHPDRFINEPEKQKLANEILQGLNEAYDFLMKGL